MHNTYFWISVHQVRSLLVACLFMMKALYIDYELSMVSADGEVYSIQHYVIKFVFMTCDRLVVFSGYSGFLHLGMKIHRYTLYMFLLLACFRKEKHQITVIGFSDPE
jgi:hypothetical protein